jgi:hypothetical protein
MDRLRVLRGDVLGTAAIMFLWRFACGLCHDVRGK